MILDATWSRASARRAADRTASRTAARLIALECVAPESVRTERVTNRSRAGQDLSDADDRVTRVLEREFEPWDSAVRLDSTVEKAQSVRAAEEAAGPS